ncbi:MAG: phosphoenolpyruvate--protein phosphotransferase [Oscillospiraceae bacterium]
MKILKGVAAAKGMVLGEIKIITRRYSGLNRVVKSPETEKTLFEAACVLAKDEIDYLVLNSEGEEKDIFGFQRAVLEDNTLLSEVYDYIFAGAGAAAAVERASRIFEKKMQSLKDDYFRQRSVDIKDACHRIVNILDGRQTKHIIMDKPVILVADDIFPSDLMGIDRKNLLGFVTSCGSPQSHAAILAKTIGIPAIVMVNDEFTADQNGLLVALDGTNGEIYICPDEEIIAKFEESIKKNRSQIKALEKLKDRPCVTLDGTRINLYANCSDTDDVATAFAHGADGIGLIRSEFLVENSGKLPGEEEQYKFYTDCLKLAHGHIVTVRTFDFGSDKPIPNVIRHSEMNPALGLRGLRLCLAKPEIFRTQLRALLRAGQFGDLRIMLPMVSSVEEIEKAREIYKEAENQLEEGGIPFSKQISFGIMVETPAAALRAEELAQKADFFSVGTNDLTQFTHAVDRTNPLVEGYYPMFSKAVERLVHFTVEAAKVANIPVCICGEVAANEEYIKRILRIGINTISVSPRSIAEIKAFLLKVDLNKP